MRSLPHSKSQPGCQRSAIGPWGMFRGGEAASYIMMPMVGERLVNGWLAMGNDGWLAMGNDG